VLITVVVPVLEVRPPVVPVVPVVVPVPVVSVVDAPSLPSPLASEPELPLEVLLADP